MRKTRCSKQIKVITKCSNFLKSKKWEIGRELCIKKTKMLKNLIAQRRLPIVDLDKVVHYHFDKAIHHAIPTAELSEMFYQMRP